MIPRIIRNLLRAFNLVLLRTSYPARNRAAEIKSSTAARRAATTPAAQRIGAAHHPKNGRIDEMKYNDSDHGRNEMHWINWPKVSRGLAFLNHSCHLAEQGNEILPRRFVQVRRLPRAARIISPCSDSGIEWDDWQCNQSVRPRRASNFSRGGRFAGQAFSMLCSVLRKPGPTLRCRVFPCP